MKGLQPKSVAEQLLYSTVRIVGDSGTGTGFFYNFKLNDTSRVELILTNKHVISGNNKLHLYFHEAQDNAGVYEPIDQSFLLTIDNFSSIWIPHPNKDVDLGALLFVPVRNHAKNVMQKNIYALFLDDNLIKDDKTLELEADVSDEILMIGYPIGLWDEHNNFPLIRKGIAASHPALDFNGESKGVVDIACFPGSSGSPILIHMNGYIDKSNNYQIGACKNILIGLLSSGPFYTSTGQIEIKEIPTVAVPTFSTSQMIHLGYYVKAKEILVLSAHIKKTLLQQVS